MLQLKRYLKPYLALALAAVVMYQLVLRVEKILNRTWGVQS